IEALLRGGQLKAGDQLPSERELAGLLGVSRSSLRESLRVLEALGIIEIRLGGGPDSGAVLRSEPGNGFVRLLQLELAMGHFASSDVLGTRLALEEWSCVHAAKLASPSDIKELSQILDRMDDPGISTPDFNTLDTMFHVRIAEAAGNSLTAHLMGSLRLLIRQQMVEAYARLEDWRVTAVTVRAEHRSILESIAEHQPDVARTRIHDHIVSFFTRPGMAGLLTQMEAEEHSAP
ncbi:MAG: FadR/GntR family transcriptional regulator, partial [Propionicimonas sp.]|nr:FadR/GntR family transcriptional regulator [Propionicimonas sp.]